MSQFRDDALDHDAGVSTRPPLPVDDALADLVAALGSARRAVLHAPPGAGKTTRVPPALLDAPWLEGRVVMLEPRRVAARAAAARIASELGGRVGELVGHRVRHDTKVSAATRIEVVTEGVLTRMLQDDPSLTGVGAVVFDEFHERSLHADLGLALTLEAQTALRPDLALVVMSATLDDTRIAAALGDAPVVRSEGRRHPVDTHHHPGQGDLEPRMASVIEHAWHHDTGDILAFLPGARWIRRTAERLVGRLPGGVVLPLHGSLDAAEQDRALAADPGGRRKVVLATDIAETSLTIDGVRVVVDGGQRRAPRFDPRSGLTRLETGRISLASADQRRGRAGRQAPGVCHRLWSETDEQHMAEFDPPEIAVADLSGLRLQLGSWGATADELTWIDRPPGHALAEAEALLGTLGALDDEGRLTPHGRDMAGFGAEPRLAHMMLRARSQGIGALACDVAGLLSGRDPLPRSAGVDLRDRVLAVRRGGGSPALREARQAADRWRRDLGVGDDRVDVDAVGRVVAIAFPDRVGRQRGGPARYLLASGRGAELPERDPLLGTAMLAVADVDGEPAGGRIHLAAPLDPAALEAALSDLVQVVDQVGWDERRGDVVAERQRRVGALVLKREPIEAPDPTALAAAWADGVAQLGLGMLPWTPAIDQWRDRVAFLHRVDPEGWPDLSDAALSATTGAWLAPHLVGVRRRRDLAGLDLGTVLRSHLPWDRQRQVDELAPTHLTVPSGSNVRLDYSSPDGPVLAVRLQELFGLTETPRVAAGRVPLVVHLLSPAGRPVQVTTDLANFWRETYPQVKAELKGRYPKHHWPEDPLTAEATARTKKRR